MKTNEIAVSPRAIQVAAAGHDPALLIVGAVEEDSARTSVFDQFPWRARCAMDCFEAFLFLHSDPPRVVVCEENLPDGSWKDVLTIAEDLENPPCVVVTSRLADDRLWAEVLNLGGYDLLAKPLDRLEVRRSLHLAWQHWANRREETRRKSLGLRRRCGQKWLTA